MNIYLLTQEGVRDYDTYDSCVVVADTEEDAARIHPSHSGGWEDRPQFAVWANKPENVKVVLVGTAASTFKAGDVVVSSFNAG